MNFNSEFLSIKHNIILIAYTDMLIILIASFLGGSDAWLFLKGILTNMNCRYERWINVKNKIMVYGEASAAVWI